MIPYEEVTNTIMNKRRFGKESGARVTAHILERLSHPEKGMRIIKIAGTNGKGSTAAFVSSILQAAGFCVGMFTSPHLVSFNERIKVNGLDISDADIVRLGSEILNLKLDFEDTMFDDCLAISLLYFKERGCDYVILEAGLGGRLDSTAGVGETALVTVITRIGLDHTAILGDTIEQIAAEKAGILQKGTRLVTAVNDETAVKVIEEHAARLGISVDITDEERDFLNNILNDDIALGLRGAYQRENARNAVLATLKLYEADKAASGVRAIGKYDIGTLSEIIKKGLINAVWCGRMEIVSESPLVILDGAHNPQGIAALSDSLRKEWAGRRFFFVTGMLADKDYTSMITPLVEIGECFFTAPIKNTPRSLTAEKLAEEITAAGGKALACESGLAAFDRALLSCKEALGRGDYGIVACGSLYFIGELMADFNKIKRGFIL